MSTRNALRRLAGATSAAVLATAIVRELRRPAAEREWHGTVGPIPYDLRPPTASRLRQRWWNPDDPRLLTPHVFGAGWSVNLARLVRAGRARR